MVIDPVGPGVPSSDGSSAGRLDPAVVALLRTPPTPMARTRLLSGWCAAVDRLVVACGIAVVALALASAVWSWTGDRTLIAPGTLEGMLGWLIMPGWIWIIGSAFALNGSGRHTGRRSLPNGLSRTMKVVLAFGGIVIVATIFHSSQLGMSEGALRHPAPGIYQVDPESSGAPGWATVSQAEYQRWSARFVRVLTPLAFFGLAMAGAGLSFLSLHRRAVEIEGATAVRMDPPGGGRGTGGPYQR